MPPLQRISTLMFSLRILALLCAAMVCLQAPARAENPDIEKVKDQLFKRELKALDEAAEILEAVNDEASAKKAVIKLTGVFRMLPPPISANQETLVIWAKAQNRVSFQMRRLMEEPYFEKLKLQALWTLITDPFSRPSAN